MHGYGGGGAHCPRDHWRNYRYYDEICVEVAKNIKILATPSLPPDPLVTPLGGVRPPKSPSLRGGTALSNGSGEAARSLGSFDRQFFGIEFAARPIALQWLSNEPGLVQ